MWLYNRSFHFITFIYLVDYKNTQGVTLPWPTVSGASPEKTQMTGMDLNAWGPESSGPSLHISATWAGMTRWPAVLWLWTRTPVCYSLSVTGILIAWGLGPERETFPRTWGYAHGLEWSSTESHEHHSDSFCWWEVKHKPTHTQREN